MQGFLGLKLWASEFRAQGFVALECRGLQGCVNGSKMPGPTDWGSGGGEETS